MKALLKRVAKEGGRCSANDDKYAPILPWCDDRGEKTDTFNLANEQGYLRTTHDSDSDDSVTYLTPKGRAAVEAMTSQPMTPGGAMSDDNQAMTEKNSQGLAAYETWAIDHGVPTSAEVQPLTDFDLVRQWITATESSFTLRKTVAELPYPVLAALIREHSTQQATIEALTAQVSEAQRNEAHWKANHNHIKERIRVLLDRPDLPQPRKHVLEYFDRRESELLSRAEKAEANQRTPGTVELCEARYHPHCIGRPKPHCPNDDCPMAT
jgi:hypothetical protein